MLHGVYKEGAWTLQDAEGAINEVWGKKLIQFH